MQPSPSRAGRHQQASPLLAAATWARSNLGALVLVLFVYLLFAGHRSSSSTASNYRSFKPRDLPPPPPREPSPFRAPLCAAPAWPGAALVEDVGHCPDAAWGAVYANYQADELIKLDINSHIPGPWSADKPPPVVSAATCAQACAAEPRCNAWTFCADHRYGCGECFPQTAGHTAPGDPMKKFGPHGGCTPDGAYPFATCSLKRVKDVTKPKPADDADFDSWISGVKGGGVPPGDEVQESRQAVDSAAGRAHAREGGGGGGGDGAAKAAAGKHDAGP